jgi:hypothetical protein
VFYGFDQYFWHRRGRSEARNRDGLQRRRLRRRREPNQVQLLDGDRRQGVVPGRPHDSDNLVPFLRLDLGLDHEDVVEIFYVAAITQWLRKSLDLQIVNPGLLRTLNSGGTGLDEVPAPPRPGRAGPGMARAHRRPRLTWEGRRTRMRRGRRSDDIQPEGESGPFR